MKMHPSMYFDIVFVVESQTSYSFLNLVFLKENILKITQMLLIKHLQKALYISNMWWGNNM